MSCLDGALELHLLLVQGGRLHGSEEMGMSTQEKRSRRSAWFEVGIDRLIHRIDNRGSTRPTITGICYGSM